MSAKLVLDIGAASGEYSKSLDAPQPLCTIADISTVWALGDIYERDFAGIKMGEQAQVTLDAYPNQRWPGRVGVRSDVVDPTTRTLHLRVERCCRTAQAIAEHFVAHRHIIAALYPGLPNHPGHAVAARQMLGGFGGMLSIRVAGGESFVPLVRRERGVGVAEGGATREELLRGRGVVDHELHCVATAPAIAAQMTGMPLPIEAKEYDLTIPMFNTDGRFQAETLATLKRSFADLKLLDTPPDMTTLYTEEFLPK